MGDVGETMADAVTVEDAAVTCRPEDGGTAAGWVNMDERTGLFVMERRDRPPSCTRFYIYQISLRLGDGMVKRGRHSAQ